jgi:hypothetical protein
MDWQVQSSNLRLPPDLIDDYLWLQKSYQQAQAEYRKRTPPISRLRNLIKQNCKPAKTSRWQFLENVWVWNDAVVFELERAWWNDVPGSGEWLSYLRRMYVVDSKRGVGHGTAFIRSLQSWAEDSGAAISLISCHFGLSREMHDKGPFFLESVEEVVDIWDTAEIQPVFCHDWLRCWYATRGFHNVMLLDNGFFSFRSDIASSDQFVFIPKSLDDSAKLAASHRWKHEPTDEQSTI